MLLQALKLVAGDIRVGSPSNLDTESDELTNESDVEAQFKNTDPTLTIRGCAYNPELGTIHARIALGERGLHDWAINPEDSAELLDLEEKSAETPRRVDFYFSRSGFEGILVTEVVGMKDPVRLLQSWVRVLSLQKRQEVLDRIDDEDEHFDNDGEKISKSKAQELAPKTVSFKATRLADPALLKKIINEIQSMQAEYVELDENNKETTKKLVINVKEEHARKNIANLLVKASTSDTSLVRETLEEVDMSPEELRAARFNPDHMKARIRGSEASTTLEPGKLSDLFNYKFKQSGQPSHIPYYRTTLAKVDELKMPSRIALKVPEDSELIDWVEREETSWIRTESQSKE